MKLPLPDVDKIFSGPLSYIWVVIKNLVVVLLVLLLYSVAATKFETAVFSVLLLILLHQVGFQELLAYGTYDQNLYIARVVKLILIGLKADDNYSSELQNQISRSEKILSGLQTELVISSVFYYFLVLLILWKIVSIVL